MQRSQWILGLFVILLYREQLQAHMMHAETVAKEWREENLPPFDELILSWNGTRPPVGQHLFYVSVKVDDWSPWLLYASWGSEEQSSFQQTAENMPVEVYQDAVEVKEGKKATGFQIRIEGEAPLERLHHLHVYTNSDRESEPQQKIEYSSSVYLRMPGLSQMALSHIRHLDLCSPTSTTAVTRYLANNGSIDPIHFAENSRDKGFDIFGNWVFNVAQASTELGREWHCWVERLSGFDAIYERLHQGTPVIVSVRGPLPGSALPYAKGHLMAVVGYEAQERKVICMDPAFPSDPETHVLYDLAEFVQAWSRRGRIAYVFSRIRL